MKHEFHARLARAAIIVTALACLAACGSLRPVPPPGTGTSFRTSVEAVDPKTPAPRTDLTLDEVKSAFGTLFVSTRKVSSQKLAQQWTYAEIATLGGFLAVAGQLADKTGLLNTGLGLAMTGLSFSQFYDPGKTKEVHLAAEGMFVCMNGELGRVNEATRLMALKSSDAKGAAAAQSAVDDVIGKIDEAIFAYRKKVMNQASTAPTKADFARFAKEYVETDEQAKKLEENAATKRSLALVNKERQVALRAKANTMADGTEKRNLLAQADPQIARADQEVAEADALAAGAKFIPLQPKLEKCLQDFGR